jgi:hypothetical protein
MATRAQIAKRSAFLFTDFGESMARRYFGDTVEKLVGRYVRGKHKGCLRGQIAWRKVVKGGWVSTYGGTGNNDYAGYVENRVGKVIDVQLQTAPWGAWGEEPKTLAHWVRDE